MKQQEMLQAFNHNDGQYIEVDSAKIYYEIQGNQTGEPIVFLHGGFGSIKDFNSILSQLGQNYRLIGIDSRGHGKSTLGTDKLTYKRLEDDLIAVIGHLGLGAVTIIGHSDGGIAAQRIAAGQVVNLKKLVVIGTHWTLKVDDPVREIYASVTTESWQGMFPDSYALYQAVNPAPNFEKITTSLLNLWLDTSEDGYPGEMVRNIDCETLIIRGDDDMLVSRIDIVELTERIKTGTLLNLPFAGHSAHEEQPEIFIWAFSEFMKAELSPDNS